jgi:hypothetical protein
MPRVWSAGRVHPGMEAWMGMPWRLVFPLTPVRSFSCTHSERFHHAHHYWPSHLPWHRRDHMHPAVTRCPRSHCSGTAGTAGIIPNNPPDRFCQAWLITHRKTIQCDHFTRCHMPHCTLSPLEDGQATHDDDVRPNDTSGSMPSALMCWTWSQQATQHPLRCSRSSAATSVTLTRLFDSP